MSRFRDPKLKRCRYLGISPMSIGVDKQSNRKNAAGAHKKVSEYAVQLKEKQKLKFVYGVGEKQFRKYFTMASAKKGRTGELLLQILESRLDNVVYRLGFAVSRPQARQLVNHAHFEVNGKKVNIPSYLVCPGDVITVRESKKECGAIKQAIELTKTMAVPKWLEKNVEKLTGKVLKLSDREDIDIPIEEHLIVELYSK